MDTLIIAVNCRPPNRNGPPQLGITVEAPYLVAYHQQQRLQLQQQQQQQKQQQAKEYRNHDYQNLHIPLSNGTTTTTKAYNDNKSNKTNHHQPMQQNQNGTTSKFISSSTVNKHNNITSSLGEQVQRGLQITQIQKNSVIDLNGQFKIGDIVVEVNGVDLQRRTFQDAQTTLKEFVKQSSHCPLQLKVLRKSPSASSSSSLPSTTGSQATVIERDVDSNDDLSPISNSKITTVTTISNGRSKPNTLTNSASTPSPQSFSGARHFAGALNTRKIGAIINVKLTKSNDGGFGIKIAERDNMFGSNRPIYITAITTTGAAFRDGRLREGDMLLEVNGIDLSGKSQPEVTKMLKSVNVNESVDFVVSRPQTEDHNNINQVARNQVENNPNTDSGYDNNKSLIDLDAPDTEDLVFTDSSNHQFEKKIDSIFNVPNLDGPGTYIYDIPLNDTKSAGLGLYLKYPTLDRRDLGIWIEKVITGGAAWKDGRLQPDDQILAINGINLMGLSNAEASETLMAAVCRGIGPEVTPNTIRLNIHRRDPSVVAKILHGTNNRIEHSDLPTNGHNKSYSITDKMMNNTTDSYKTAFDNTLHSRSQTSSDTSKSSNQNSQTDSALSPQTQASNSLKLTNSCNDKSDPNSSDKTNDTSSAISQITDFTTVPLIADNNISPVKDSNIDNDNNQAFITLPKTLDVSEVNVQDVDPASSVQSWDDDSIDAATGEERFQRDGFGRQSISEKRHAQLMAKNTDTYKRNQKLREERDRQRQVHENFERMRLDDFKRHSLNPNIMSSNQQPMIVNSSTSDDINSMYVKPIPVLANEGVVIGGNLRNDPMNYHTREVPVDVQIPVELGMNHRNGEVYNDQARMFYGSNNNQQQQQSNNIIDNNDYNRISNQMIGDYGHHHQNQHQHHQNQILPNQVSFIPPCWKCGSVIPCLCNPNGIGHFQQNPQHQTCNIYPAYNTHMAERSNSLESIQHHLNTQHNPFLGGPMIPRAGTVRVARNRKINESFRAAVDRSYEININDTGRYNYAMNDRSDSSTKMSGSIAKSSSTSASNDERILINSHNNGSGNSANNNHNNNNTNHHKKSSSLLTKFLKFGSMKEYKDKDKHKETHISEQRNKFNVPNNEQMGKGKVVVVPVPVESGMNAIVNGQVYDNQARLYHNNNNNINHHNNNDKMPNNQMIPDYGHHPQQQQQQRQASQMTRMPCCWKCGSVIPCMCNTNVINQPHHPQQPYNPLYSPPGYNNRVVDRSNSLESIQQQQHHHQNHHNQNDQMRGHVIIPRSSTVRVGKDRKVNESSRAAVDRTPYVVNTNGPPPGHRLDDHAVNDRKSHSGSRNSNSGAKSSSRQNHTSTNHENNDTSNNTNANHTKKSSSLLTKFLKFGSMKDTKRRNKIAQTTNTEFRNSFTATSSKQLIVGDSLKGSMKTESTTVSTGSHQNPQQLQYHNHNHHQNHNHQYHHQSASGTTSATCYSTMNQGPTMNSTAAAHYPQATPSTFYPASTARNTLPQQQPSWMATLI